MEKSKEGRGVGNARSGCLCVEILKKEGKLPLTKWHLKKTRGEVDSHGDDWGEN